MPLSDQQWETFFAAAEMTETLKADPRFADYKARAQHIRELYGLVEQVTITKTTDEWIAILKPRSVPVGVVNRLDDLQEDEHLKAVGFFERYEHPQAGAYYGVKPPVRFSKTPSNIRRHAPRLGEHTDEVLAEIEAGS
jgi:crotonobetainyl-CoA:carnitine CoA-transferase CaiB-like acyl-CoA transferase